MNVYKFLENNYEIKNIDSTELLYDNMESQSGECLPVLYKEFDIENKYHWLDRGFLWDYYYSINAGKSEKILDFGPGDGWPSLILAPFVKRIIGVDASKKRVEVCRKNAEKLNIENVEFILNKHKIKLPFNDNSFDGITAASSVEETPNPIKILEEFYRVLKPGGIIRIHFCAIDNTHDYFFINKNDQFSLCMNRLDYKNDIITKYRILIRNSKNDFLKKINYKEDNDFYNKLTKNIDVVKSEFLEVSKTQLFQPGIETYTKILKRIGFEDIRSTYSGGYIAKSLFNDKRLNRPENINELDDYLKPIVKNVVDMKAPGGYSSMLTFKKGE